MRPSAATNRKWMNSAQDEKALDRRGRKSEYAGQNGMACALLDQDWANAMRLSDCE